MKVYHFLLWLSVGLIFGCTQNNSNVPNYIQMNIKEANTTPTVDIKDFTLVSNNLTVDSLEALEIMKVKRNFPLAMQKHDSLLFESILSKDFTFRAQNEFFNRADYIANRIHGTWTIDTVKFKNLVLQFFNQSAVLTYTNILNGTDDNGKRDTEYYNWADIYLKENGKWKIAGVHEIESRIEYSKP
ncbi:MAG TPA: nuclear transport factor 2 family protein [Niabella sp.]|nr:nuclear transport factor 2 family protein [Niabella sp.]